jgi:hypothetical protein
VQRLTLEEKVALLSGHDKWSLPAVSAIGLESIVVSDGPTGVERDGSVPIRTSHSRRQGARRVVEHRPRRGDRLAAR